MQNVYQNSISIRKIMLFLIELNMTCIDQTTYQYYYIIYINVCIYLFTVYNLKHLIFILALLGHSIFRNYYMLQNHWVPCAMLLKEHSNIPTLIHCSLFECFVNNGAFLIYATIWNSWNLSLTPVFPLLGRVTAPSMLSAQPVSVLLLPWSNVKQ